MRGRSRGNVRGVRGCKMSELYKQIKFNSWKRIMDNTGKQRIGVKSYEGKRSIKKSYKEYAKGNESGQGDG